VLDEGRTCSDLLRGGSMHWCSVLRTAAAAAAAGVFVSVNFLLCVFEGKGAEVERNK